MYERGSSSGPANFSDVTILSPEGDGPITASIRSAATNLIAGPVVNSAFTFRSPRLDLSLGPLNFSHRRDTSWGIVGTFGQSANVGTNESVGMANSTTAFTFNTLDLGSQLAGFISCIPNPTTCGVMGTNSYDGYYGRSETVTPGSLGVAADTASSTTITHIADGSAPPTVCPPAYTPPPPRTIMGTVNVNGFRGSWASVPCALGYIVEVQYATGLREVLVSSDTLLEVSGSRAANIINFVVISVGSGGNGSRSAVIGVLRV